MVEEGLVEQMSDLQWRKKKKHFSLRENNIYNLSEGENI